MAPRHKGYVDTSYLDTVHGLLADLKLLTYERMRVEPGQRVLDVGCGPGIDTIALAARVGPAGQVTGIDHDAEMIAEADRRAQEAGVTALVTHERADATELPFAAEHFDACRCERLLEHLYDPAKALSEMARVTRPGGWIVVLDGDWGSLSIDASEIEAERNYVRHFATHMAHNPFSGRQLYRLLRQQGLVEVSVQMCGVLFTDYAYARQVMIMERFEREALASGSVSGEDLDLLHACWELADADGVFFAGMSMILVSGRKP